MWRVENGKRMAETVQCVTCCVHGQRMGHGGSQRGPGYGCGAQRHTNKSFGTGDDTDIHNFILEVDFLSDSTRLVSASDSDQTPTQTFSCRIEFIQIYARDRHNLFSDERLVTPEHAPAGSTRRWEGQPLVNDWLRESTHNLEARDVGRVSPGEQLATREHAVLA